MDCRKLNDKELAKRRFIFAVLTFFMLVNTGVNVGIDFLLNGRITWSLYPVYSVFFTWLICIAPLLYKYRGFPTLAVSLGVFSTLLLPYLWLMDLVWTQTRWFMPIALPISLAAIVFLWLGYLAFCIYYMRSKKRVLS